ncbi:hypothetical protein MTO96_028285 [Rhipicephalus appendiculatus]
MPCLDNSHVSTIEAALPMTLDHNVNSRVFILKTLCLTTSRYGKDSTDPITKMRLTTNTTDSRERQRPVILMITNLLTDSSGLRFFQNKSVDSKSRESPAGDVSLDENIGEVVVLATTPQNSSEEQKVSWKVADRKNDWVQKFKRSTPYNYIKWNLKIPILARVFDAVNQEVT